MSITDQEILQQIADHDSAALAALYDRYGRLVYGVLLSITHDAEDAEDITQEVFLQVWRKASQYQPALGAPKNWLVRIAHNRGVNHIRSRRERERKSGTSVNAAGGELILNHPSLATENTWDETVNTEQAFYISEAMNALPKEQQMLIDLAFFQGYTHSEIAEKTGIALGTVKTRIRSALSSLRKRLQFMNDEVANEHS